MVAVHSTMLPLGTKAPEFSLYDTISGKILSLQTLKSPAATVVMFICNHCPFVIHIHKKLVEIAKEYQAKGVSFIAICSNDAITYPDDGPKKMTETAKKWGMDFPYLHDETQEVAKAYHAACTPDFYVFDSQLRCVYRGQFDDARPGLEVPITGQDLARALDQLLSGKEIDKHQKPSMGCNIKWKQHA